MLFELENINKVRASEQQPLDDPGAASSPALIPVTRANDFVQTPRIDRKVYDTWYEKFLLTMTKPETPLYAPELEMAAGAIKAVPDVVGNYLAAGLMVGGDIFSPPEQTLFDYQAPETEKGLIDALAGTPFAGPAAMSSMIKIGRRIATQAQSLTGQEFFASEPKNNRQRIAQMMSATGFYLYANSKHFNERLKSQINYPLAFDVGNVGGQVAMSALLGSVNPTLALGVLTGNITAVKYLENRAQGVPWQPSALMAGIIGGAEGSVERLSLGVLYKKYASKWGFIGDMVLANSAEEAIQQEIEIGSEEILGRREVNPLEDIKEISYNAFLGALGAGIGAPMVISAHERIMNNLKKMGVDSEVQDAMATKILGLGYEVGHELIKETSGVDQKYFDDFKLLTEGKLDPKLFSQSLVESFEKRVPVIQPQDVSEEAIQQAVIEQQVQDSVVAPGAIKPEGTRPDIELAAKTIIRGREAKLEEERVAIEEQMDTLEKELAAETKEVKKFGSTPEAVTFGYMNRNNPEVLAELERRRADISARISVINERTDLTKAEEQAAYDLAVEGQFYREALDTAKGKIPLTRATPKLQKLLELSKQLEPIHHQFADLGDIAVEQLQKEKIITTGRQVERVRQVASQEGAKAEARKLKLLFREQKGASDELRKAAERYVKQNLPRDLRGDFLTRVNAIKTEKNLTDLIEQVNTKRETFLRKKYEGLVEEELEKLAPKSERSIQKGKFATASLQDVANKIIEISSLNKQEVNARLSENTLKIREMLNNASSVSVREGEQHLIDKWSPDDLELLEFENSLLESFGAVEERSAEELQSTLRELRGMREKLRMTAQAIIDERKAQEEAFVASAVSEIRPPEVEKNLKESKKSLMSKALSYFNRIQSGLITAPASDVGTLLNLLSNKKGPQEQRIFKDLAEKYFEASRVEASYISFLVDAHNQVLKTAYGATTEEQRQDIIRDRNSYKTEKGAYIKEDAVDSTGEKVTGGYSWSKGDIIRYWILTHNIDGSVNSQKWEYVTGEQAFADIEKDLAAGTLEKESPEYKARIKTIPGNKIQSSDLNAAFSRLSAQDQQYATLIKQMYSFEYPLWNAMYREVYKTNLPREVEYYPEFKEAQGQEIDSMLDELSLRFMAAAPKSFKERTPFARAAIKQLSVDDDLTTTALEMAHFLAYGKLVKDTYKLLRNPDIRNAVNQVTDGEKLKTGKWADGNYYQQLLNRVEMIASRGRLHLKLNKFLRNINQNTSAMLTGGQVDIGAGQVIQVLAALEFISPAELTAGVMDFKNNPESVLKLVMKSPIKTTRAQNFLLEVRDIIKSGRSGQLDVLGDGKDWRTLYFLPIALGDNFSTTVGGYSVLRAVYKKTGDIDQAYRKMDEYIEKTQQSARLTQLSAAQTANWRVLFKFISYPLTATRRVLNAVHDARTGQISGFEAVKRTLLYWVVLSSLFDLSKKLWDWRLKDLVSSSLTGQIGAIPVLGNFLHNVVVSALNHAFPEDDKDRRYPTSFAILAAPEKIEQSIDKSLTAIENQKWENLFDGVVDAVTYTLGATKGVPVQAGNVAKVLYRVGQEELPAEAILHTLFGRTASQTEKFFQERE